MVVGGGTAGLAVAYRLAEDGKYTVAVVEAGGFYQLESGNQSVVPSNNYQFASLQVCNFEVFVIREKPSISPPNANTALPFAFGQKLANLANPNSHQMSIPWWTGAL